MNRRSIKVIKASGEEVPFSAEKVVSSMERAMIPPDLRRKALAYLETVIYPGIPTRGIYKLLFDYLRSINRPAAAKYSLKSAIMALGPSGFPFEKFVAKLFEAKGYSTKTDVFIKGVCIEHEIDIEATKGTEKLMIECKFHNKPGIKTDAKAALYIYSRFLDIAEQTQPAPYHNGTGFTQPWIVTNTKITQNVRKYSECKDMKVLSWEYPILNRLPVWIERENLHPITALTTLSQTQKELLLQEGIVLCRDLIKLGPKELKKFTIKEERSKQIVEEANSLIAP